jgi:hypothetical protein
MRSLPPIKGYLGSDVRAHSDDRAHASQRQRSKESLKSGGRVSYLCLSGLYILIVGLGKVDRQKIEQRIV